jgi:hypothetical protein
MTDFSSDWAAMTSVVDRTDRPAGGEWSSINSMLTWTGDPPTFPQPFGYASSYVTDVAWDIEVPKIEFPGGTPIVDDVTINEIFYQVEWARLFGSAGIDLWDVLIQNSTGSQAGNDIEGQFDPIDAQARIEFGGDLAFWGITQTQAKNLFWDTNTPSQDRMNLRIRRNPNVSSGQQLRVYFMRARVNYTYTGTGVAFPRLF